MLNSSTNLSGKMLSVMYLSEWNNENTVGLTLTYD